MLSSGFESASIINLREQILSELPCGICAARQDDRLSLVFANDSFYHMLGYLNAEDAQKSGIVGALDCVEERTRSAASRQLEQMLRSQEQATSLEARLKRQDGSFLWCMIRIRRSAQEGLWICAFMDISAQKRVEDELRVREEEYRIAVRQSDKFVLRYEIARQTAYLPPEAAELFGCSVIDNMPGSLEECGVVSPDSMEAYHDLFNRIVTGVQQTGDAMLQLKLASDAGEYDWYRVTYSIIYIEDHTPAQAVISLQNVSEQHKREVAYRRWEKSYEAMPQGNTAYLEFDLTRNRFEAQKGALLAPIPEENRASMEEAVLYFLSNYVHADDYEKMRAYTAREHFLTEYFRGSKLERPEYRHLKPDGRYVWVRLSVQMLPDPYSSNVRASFLLRDIDTQKREELILQDQLRTDALTGALNRIAFVEAADAVFAQSRGGALHALVMVDVDHFKRVNDRFGHGCGDRMLIRVCDALRGALRADDLVGRLGGDEFVLLLKNVLNRDALQTKLSYLCAQLNQQINDEMMVTCSFGAAFCPYDGESFEELYCRADIALYAAKEAGRNCTRIYERTMGRPMTLFEASEIP